MCTRDSASSSSLAQVHIAQGHAPPLSCTGESLAGGAAAGEGVNLSHPQSSLELSEDLRDSIVRLAKRWRRFPLSSPELQPRLRVFVAAVSHIGPDACPPQRPLLTSSEVRPDPKIRTTSMIISLRKRGKRSLRVALLSGDCCRALHFRQVIGLVTDE